MCSRDINNVNVVAQASAVRSLVIVTVDAEMASLSGGGLKQEGNNMRFGIVSFSQISRSPGSIEIAQGNHAPAVSARVPVEGAFEHQLGLTVRVDRVFRIVLI